jgi:hypothetical protein
MNGDGTPDFVYWTAPLVEQFRLNRGAGRFEPQLTEATSSSLGLDRTRAAIGDLNGDGRPDTAYATLYERNGDWNA